jgi:hypothetical protein
MEGSLLYTPWEADKADNAGLCPFVNLGQQVFQERT